MQRRLNLEFITAQNRGIRYKKHPPFETRATHNMLHMYMMYICSMLMYICALRALVGVLLWHYQNTFCVFQFIMHVYTTAPHGEVTGRKKGSTRLGFLHTKVQSGPEVLN